MTHNLFFVSVCLFVCVFLKPLKVYVDGNGISKAGSSKHFIQFAICVISVYMVIVLSVCVCTGSQGGNMKVHKNSLS